MADLALVVLAPPTGRFLAGPVELAQDAADVGGVVFEPQADPEQVRHPGQGPEGGDVSQGLGPAPEFGLQLEPLEGLEARLASGPARGSNASPRPCP